jgi:hypothetical protein
MGLKVGLYARPYKSPGASSPRANYACALFLPGSIGGSHFVGARFFSQLTVGALRVAGREQAMTDFERGGRASIFAN